MKNTILLQHMTNYKALSTYINTILVSVYMRVHVHKAKSRKE